MVPEKRERFFLVFLTDARAPLLALRAFCPDPRSLKREGSSKYAKLTSGENKKKKKKKNENENERRRRRRRGKRGEEDAGVFLTPRLQSVLNHTYWQEREGMNYLLLIRTPVSKSPSLPSFYYRPCDADAKVRMQ